MSFRSMRPGKTAAAAAPAPAGTPAETAAKLREAAAAIPTVTAEVVPAPAAVAVPVSAPATPLSSMLATLGMSPAKGGGVRALSTVANASSFSTMYPCVRLMGGTSGGTLAPHASTPAEYIPKLPQGVASVQGVFLSYRYLVSSWPVDYDHKTDETRPVFMAIVPNDATDDIALAMAAAKRYNFTGKVDRPGKFDFDVSGVGHISPTLEILMFVPSLGDLMMLSVSNYSNVEATNASLEKYIDPETGLLNPFPCTVRPVTEQTTNSKGKGWKVHRLDFNGEPNATGAKLAAEFAAWLSGSTADPEIAKDFQTWVKGGDGQVLDAKLRDILTKAKHL